MTRNPPNWQTLWPWLLLWVAAPMPLYIWLAVELVL